jgi:hypothetical protein
MRFDVVLDCSRGAQNLVGCHAPALASELVTAVRASNAFQNPATHQRLQNRFKMPRRQAVMRSERFCGNRLAMVLQCHINHRGDCEGCFSR